MARKRSPEPTTTVSAEGAGAAAAPAKKRRIPRPKSSAAIQPAPELSAPENAVPESLSALSSAAAPEASFDPAAEREEIEHLAHAYWEARGCPEGTAEEDWLRAEQEVRARRAAAGG
jgi:hypothetical protein